jgi:hypothetical protein
LYRTPIRVLSRPPQLSSFVNEGSERGPTGRLRRLVGGDRPDGSVFSHYQ